jgi:hypothetical protein
LIACFDRLKLLIELNTLKANKCLQAQKSFAIITSTTTKQQTKGEHYENIY